MLSTSNSPWFALIYNRCIHKKPFYICFEYKYITGKSIIVPQLLYGGFDLLNGSFGLLNSRLKAVIILPAVVSRCLFGVLFHAPSYFLCLMIHVGFQSLFSSYVYFPLLFPLLLFHFFRSFDRRVRNAGLVLCMSYRRKY